MVNNDGFDDDDAGCIDKDHDCQCTVTVYPPQSPHCIRVWLVSTGHCTVSRYLPEKTHSPTDGAAASKYCGDNTADCFSVTGLSVELKDQESFRNQLAGFVRSVSGCK